MYAMSEYRKRIINDGMELQRKQNEIERLRRENKALQARLPTPCGLCRHARETDNAAFLYCVHLQMRKTEDGFCDAGKPRR